MNEELDKTIEIMEQEIKILEIEINIREITEEVKDLEKKLTTENNDNINQLINRLNIKKENLIKLRDFKFKE